MFNLNAIINRVEYKSKYCMRTLMADISVVSETRYNKPPTNVSICRSSPIQNVVVFLYDNSFQKYYTLHPLAYIHDGSPIWIMVYSQYSTFYNNIYSEFHIFGNSDERNSDRYCLSIFHFFNLKFISDSGFTITYYFNKQWIRLSCWI